MIVTLVSISSVTGHKGIEGIFELGLTLLITEVIPLKVINKNIVFDVFNVHELPTFINTLTTGKDLSSCMSHNFSS